MDKIKSFYEKVKVKYLYLSIAKEKNKIEKNIVDRYNRREK